jgi:hypothetical protein
MFTIMNFAKTIKAIANAIAFLIFFSNLKLNNISILIQNTLLTQLIVFH